jgi:gamma-butyrobetaine dioxygenase
MKRESKKMSPVITSITTSGQTLQLEWDDGQRSIFHYFWLRDNCPQLRHKTTNHRVVETSSIPTDVRPTLAEVNTAGELRIVWQYDGHESRFAPSWLRAYDYSNGVQRARWQPMLWDATIGDHLPTASYPELVQNAAVKRAYLQGFRDYGVGILSNVPTVPGAVLEVAKHFGEVRSTSWGTVFDVRSMENANSVAYTNLPLVTHTDEAYRDPTPTIQLQHFLVADPQGGASTLVDGFKLAADLRAHAPDKFRLLSSTPLHFHFRDATTELENEGPVIELNVRGEVSGIRYSNHSVQPFLLPVEQMEAYYAAYRTFGTMRESEPYQLRIKMKSGELYMVDNRRVLHGRTGFSSSGARHLQSCYIERDELISRLNVLKR